MDDEITGMYQVATILDDLDEEARARVIRWAADKYDIDLTVPVADADVAAAAERTKSQGIDPEKMAAVQAARQAAEDTGVTAASGEFAPKVEVQPASTLENAEAPPEKKDPEKPSFLDTQFRMQAGKKQLKKETGED